MTKLLKIYKEILDLKKVKKKSFDELVSTRYKKCLVPYQQSLELEFSNLEEEINELTINQALKCLKSISNQTSIYTKTVYELILSCELLEQNKGDLE